MYQYFKGYVIREGAEGITGEKLRSLYEGVGWVNSDLAIWQNEIIITAA